MVLSAARRRDVIVVGAGHNGLTCACYLAGAGLAVTVLERRPIVGGAAVTEAFAPGFRNSTASYTLSLLRPEVIRELGLAAHGLRVVPRPYANFLPLPDGGYFRSGASTAETQAQIARFSRADAARWPAFAAMLARVADVLRGLLLATPPNPGGGLVDVARAGGVAARLWRLPIDARRDLAELLTRSAGVILDGWFEADPVKGWLGFDAVVGSYVSPYTPGTGYVLLHHALGEVDGRRGQWGHVIGGMGAVTQAMAAEAHRRGVEILTDAPVARVAVRGGRVAGVVLADGRELAARVVAAGVDPKRLFLDLVEPGALEEDFLARMRRYRSGSGSLRINVALETLPEFTCLPGPGEHLRSGILIAPSLGYLERAWLDARREGFAREPVVELLVPSTVDDSLAPPGKHVASLFCQHFAPQLPDGRSWDRERDAAADRAIAVVERHAPGFAQRILARSVLTPLDLEREFGLTGGDIFHGALAPDQLWSLRPLLGYADYRTPIAGLYLCGSGAHPGGGVTGAPGRNAARVMLRDLRRRFCIAIQ